MAGPANIEELIRALEEHPEWKPRLLSTLLTEDFLRLPHRVERLEEEILELRVETERRFQAMERSVESVIASLETLKASHATLNAAVTALIESHNRLGRQVEGMRGERAGEKYEAEKRRFGFYIFRGGRDYTGEVEVLLRLASREGAISLVEAEEANRLDFIWEKLPGGEALPCLFAVEVSLVINGHDTRRARERAAILARAAQGTHRVMPVVLGQRFTGPDAAREAEELGVEWILEEPDVRGYSDRLRPLVVGAQDR